jgi:uncharacterized protein YjbI with pentapeptide repeats
MDAYHRLSRFSSTVKERASPVLKPAAAQLGRGWLWLTVPRDPVDWKAGLASAGSWLQARTIVSRLIAGVVFVALVVVIVPRVWEAYSAHLPAIIPLGAGIGGAIVAWAALTQAATARRRHEEQTDRQRRIMESFSKAVEQLGSEKFEVRLGGIYSLERISKESPDDYWTVMENLTAFVRERSRRNEAERTALDFEQRVSRRAYFLWRDAGRPDGRTEDFWADAVRQDESGEPPAADIVAVLTVIHRRSDRSRKREGTNYWRLDLSNAILKRAILPPGARLEGAILRYAHLEGADLRHAHLEAADLRYAHLEGADLGNAHLEGSNLWGAHLERAMLGYAHLERVMLGAAHLERAMLADAHLERADLLDADLKGANLANAHLEGAYLFSAHLEGAMLADAHLEGAFLRAAHLEGAMLGAAHLERAFLRAAHLEGANFWEAHLEGVDLMEAHLEGANFWEAHLEGTNFWEAHLEGANFWSAVGLSEAQLAKTHGDAATQLPTGLAWPAHWPPRALI